MSALPANQATRRAAACGALLAWLAAFGCACNSAPKNTCNPYAHAVASAGTPPASCDGICTSVVLTTGDAGPEGGLAYELCTVDCTDGGDAVCPSGTTCVSAMPIRPSSYCVLICGNDAGDAGSCPSPLTCSDAGFCL